MVDGIADLRRRWGAIPVRVRAAVKMEMAAQADKIVAAMRQAAPKDSLALANSIGWTWGAAPSGAMTIGSLDGGDGGGWAMRITIYAGGAADTTRTQSKGAGRSGTFASDNAIYQEFGTVNMPANPYFFPVWRAYRSRARAAITRAMNRAILAG